jgi:hypothetical protein
MLVHFYLSTQMLADLVRFRLIDAYKPLASPLQTPFGNLYFDGLENVTVVDGPARTPAAPQFTLNVADTSGAQPALAAAPGVAPIAVPDPVLQANATLFALTDHDLSDPAFADPDPGSGLYKIPPQPPRLPLVVQDIEIQIALTVSPTFDVVLNATMSDPLLGDPIDSFLKNLGTISVPLPLAGALGKAVADPPILILNAGIAKTAEGDGYAIRIEISDPALPLPAQRLAAWQAFFAGGQPSALAQYGWAAELPTDYIVNQAVAQFSDQLGKPDVAKIFDNQGPTWGQWTFGQPQLTLQTDGSFLNVCGGLDIAATVVITCTLSVPQPGTLRASFSIDVSRDAWDTIKCTVLSIINPFAGIITGFDLGAPWWADIILGGFGGIIIPAIMLALVFSGNSIAVNFALQQAQDELASQGTTIIRTSSTDAYTDIAEPPLSLGATQLTLSDVAARGNDLILRGDYNQPPTTPLYLGAKLIEGFSNWVLTDKCRSTIDYQTSATIALSLHATRDAASPPVQSPPIALKYGVDPNSGQTVAWRIVDDTGGVYNGVDTRVEWSGVGIPGTFQVIVASPPESFAEAPYALHLQFYTSYGVRQFDIPAPPLVPKPPPTEQGRIAWDAAIISECYTQSSLIALIKILQIPWLGDPPEGVVSARHWQVLVDGLSPESALSAWNEHGTLLAQVRPFGGRFAELSVITEREEASLLQVTLDGREPLSPAEYRQLAADVARRAKDAPTPVTARQSTLIRLATIPLPARAEGVKLGVAGDSLAITAWDTRGAWEIGMRGLVPAGWTMVRSEAPRRAAPLPSHWMRLVVEPQVTRLVQEGRELARYIARPWFDRGSAAGGYYARLARDGLSIELYARSPARVALPLIR